jgi:hypothetical protein
VQVKHRYILRAIEDEMVFCSMITAERNRWVEYMDQTLASAAEAAYRQYQDTNEIVPELLFAWLLAEVHFAGTQTQVQTTVLDRCPKTDLETALVIETARAYREFRQGIERAERIKPKGDMHAVRPKET